MPKISVIIPTHNRAEFLRCAITSVLSQTLQDFEVIVVDDASVDNTQEVVRSFGDDRIRYLRHHVTTNKGAASARNTGVLHANGDYIAFLDDDDEWLPDKLKMQLDRLELSPPTLGGVYTGSLEVERSNGKIVSRIIPSKKGRIFDEMIIQNWIGPTSTLILRKQCFEKVGLFDASLSYSEDYDMWLRVSKEYDFDYIAEPLVKFHYHETGLSNNYQTIVRGREAVLDKHRELFARNCKAYSYRLLDLGALYCYGGNLKKGREAFRKAIKLYPFDIRNYFYLCLSWLGEENFRKLSQAKERLTPKLRLNCHLRSRKADLTSRKSA
jgi:glycosyltransferase involved in cell wall biosynthesis